MAEEHQLRRNTGYWQLTAIGFSGVIGSGWLLAGQAAAQAAGPEAIVTWLVGGAALLLIALVMVELVADVRVKVPLLYLYAQRSAVHTVVAAGTSATRVAVIRVNVPLLHLYAQRSAVHTVVAAGSMNQILRARG